MQATATTTVITTGVTLTLDMDEVNVLIGHIEARQYSSPMADALREAAGLPSRKEIAFDTLATGQYDHIVLDKKILTIKELRAVIPGLGLKEAKDAVDEYAIRLRNHRDGCDLSEWECALLHNGAGAL
jgi:ribosomal protein L7/L12